MRLFKALVLALVFGLATLLLNHQALAAAPVISSVSPNTGAAGRSIKIKGSGFTGVTSVKFNGKDATFVAASTTKIQASVPLLATTGKITVTTPDGTATSPNNFTIQEPDRPYINVNGDIFSGGWFNTGSIGCQDDNNSDQLKSFYQSPTFQNSNYTGDTYFKGGLLGYQKTDNHGNWVGSSADFGIWALGEIQSNPDSFIGFVSGQNSQVSGSDRQIGQRLIFANTGTYNQATGAFIQPPTFGGGLYSGAELKAHCIPDYAVIKKNSPKEWKGSLTEAKSGQYQAVTSVGSYSGTVLNLNSKDVTISQNKNITLFVQGDVYIGADIVYPKDFGTFTAPHFALVASGNIYISGDVEHLSGLYIAEPDADGNNGVIWTCHRNSTFVYTGSEAYANCQNPLSVSGAFIAKQVNFLRVSGNVGDPDTTPAETITYPSEIITGGAFFNQPSSAGKLKIESLVSLPPHFLGVVTLVLLL